MTKLACVNGFLGSGKTSLIIGAADEARKRGMKVGIITNDQGRFLVDTAIVREFGFAVEEVLGGCFCCRFPELLGRARKLRDRHHLDLILAEAVGSCTDLFASVYRRLREHECPEFRLSPLSVVVEPYRIQEFARLLSPFDESMNYLFGKQLAEAELILLNKSELLNAAEIAGLTSRIRYFAPELPVAPVSAKTLIGVGGWLDELLRCEAAQERELDLDYEIYARAEASLAWLNATIDLNRLTPFSPTAIGEALAVEVQRGCLDAGYAIAHLKLMFVTTEGSDWIALTNSDMPASWGKQKPLAASKDASLVINARIASPVDELRHILEVALETVTSQWAMTAKVLDLESFSPAPPIRHSFNDSVLRK